MKDSLVTLLRSKKTKRGEFRRATDKLSKMLVSEAAQKIKEKKCQVETPMCAAKGNTVAQDVILVPILRAGMALLPPFLDFFDEAKVGIFGIRRDENTALAQLYYENLPKIEKEDKIIILDPMIATAGSAIEAIKRLKACGAKLSNMLIVTFLAAPEGLRAIRRKFAEIDFLVAVKDQSLNKQKFIVPGLGDFGDRFFGT